MRNRLLCLAFVVLALATLRPGTHASAQGGVLTLHAPDAALTNGDDFATTVLGDPWDMEQRRDIGWEENLSPIEVADGIWSARVNVTNPDGGNTGYLFPLFQGFPTAWPVGKIGANYPVDTSRYTQLSYRMYVSERSYGNHAVYWTHKVDWPTGTDRFAVSDTGPNGWKLYNWDLTTANGDPGAFAGSWQSGPVYGLRIDPNPASANYRPEVVVDVKVDWVRLTDPSTSPRYTVTWQGASQEDLVGVYVDTDRDGYDGMLVASVPASAGRYDLLTCILPGGDYYVYLKAGDALSNYGGRLRINNPPILRWDLSTISQDYAATERGDGWDMSGPSDLANLGEEFFASPDLYVLRQFYDWSFNNGVFSATADANYAFDVGEYTPFRQSDVQLWPAIDPARPVDTSKYRYMVIRLWVDEPGDRTLSQRVFDGWVGRIVWWNHGVNEDGFATDEFFYYEGWNTYVIDLEARDWPAGYEPGWPALSWKSIGSVSHMRFDPLEVSNDTRFHVDEIRLLADPVVDGSLSLYLGVADPDGQNVSLRYFYDTDNKGFDGRPLTSLRLSAASEDADLAAAAAGLSRRAYLPLVALRPRPELRPLVSDSGLAVTKATLSTAAVPAGTYYLYACGSDGLAETCHYLQTPITVAHP